MTAQERTDAERDLGVGIGKRDPEAAAYALPLLEAALAARPDDTIAWEIKGWSLGLLDRGHEGIVAMRTALAQAPNRESALLGLAFVATKANQSQLAIDAFRRVIAINPWNERYRAEFAQALGRAGDWRGAVAACREALRLNPVRFELRKLLVQCLLQLGESERARAELETVLEFAPSDRDALLRWFARQR
jgi:tetratricopeptide (TPR) repeat protein